VCTLKKNNETRAYFHLYFDENESVTRATTTHGHPFHNDSRVVNSTRAPPN